MCTYRLAYKNTGSERKPDVSMADIDMGGVVIIADAGPHDRASPQVPASSSRPNLWLRYRAAA
jgi:hypothetical protein